MQVTVNYKVAKGVITAYCPGIQDRCPDWAKNAANIQAMLPSRAS